MSSTTVRVCDTDDLELLVREINTAKWDDANAMDAYDAPSLAAYLARQDTIFIACHERVGDQRTLLGIASGRIEMKPYGGELWLYVDEVDVCVDQRRKGAGKALMTFLIDYAKHSGCEEVWLGTEVDNDAANGLYRSLGPDDEAQVIGYTFETDE